MKLYLSFLFVLHTLLLHSQGLNLGFFNDSQNGAVGANKDNYRSFGFDAQYRHMDQAHGILMYSGMTNRNWEDSTKGSRVDELQFSLSYQVFESNGVRFSPVLGFIQSGDLGGEQIQNGIHESVSEPLVYLPYDYERLSSFLVGLRVDHRKEWGGHEGIPVFLETTAGYSYATQYATFADARVGLFLGDPFRTNIGAHIGYQYLGMYSGSAARAVGEQESGVRIGLEQNLAFFTFSWDVYLPSTFSSGRIGVNLLNNAPEHDFEQEDATIEFNILLDRAGYLSKYKRKVASLGELPLHVSLNHAFGTYTGNVIPDFPSTRGQYIQLGSGVELSWREVQPKFQLNPYIGSGFGGRDEMTYSGMNANAPTQHSISPIVYGEAGLRITGPIKMLSKSTILGFQIGNKYTYAFNPDVQNIGGVDVSFLQPVNDVYFGFSFISDF